MAWIYNNDKKYETPRERFNELKLYYKGSEYNVDIGVCIPSRTFDYDKSEKVDFGLGRFMLDSKDGRLNYKDREKQDQTISGIVHTLCLVKRYKDEDKNFKFEEIGRLKLIEE